MFEAVMRDYVLPHDWAVDQAGTLVKGDYEFLQAARCHPNSAANKHTSRRSYPGWMILSVEYSREIDVG